MLDVVQHGRIMDMGYLMLEVHINHGSCFVVNSSRVIQLASTSIPASWSPKMIWVLTAADRSSPTSLLVQLKIWWSEQFVACEGLVKFHAQKMLFCFFMFLPTCCLVYNNKHCFLSWVEMFQDWLLWHLNSYVHSERHLLQSCLLCVLADSGQDLFADGSRCPVPCSALWGECRLVECWWGLRCGEEMLALFRVCFSFWHLERTWKDYIQSYFMWGRVRRAECPKTFWLVLVLLCCNQHTMLSKCRFWFIFTLPWSSLWLLYASQRPYGTDYSFRAVLAGKPILDPKDPSRDPLENP